MHTKEKAAAAKKITKLLNLAKSTTSTNEAEIAFSRAKELLNKYNLETGEATLLAEGVREEFVSFGYKQPPRWIEYLVSAIADGFGCLAYSKTNQFSFYHRYMGCETFMEAFQRFPDVFQNPNNTLESFWTTGFVLLGFDLDVTVATHGYDVARRTITKLATAYLRGCPQLSPKGKYRARMSFSEGACCGLQEALLQSTRPSDIVREDEGFGTSELMVTSGLEKTKQNFLDSYRKKNWDFLAPPCKDRRKVHEF